MDNFTHSLAGWALGQTGLKTKSRKGLAALILGANMPDIDVFFGWHPWDPLAMHRGWTHSLIGGVLLLPPLLAGLLWLLDRWQVGRGTRFRSGLEMRFGWLVALAYLGALSHPLLDLQNSYAVQLLSPLDFGWFHNDSLFIIDVWIWSALSVAIWLSRRREKKGGHWRRPAIIGASAAVAYIAANTALSQYARRVVVERVAATGTPDVIVASPAPGLFWKREIVWRIDHRIGRVNYDPFTGWSGVGRQFTSLDALQPDAMDDPVVRRAIGRSRELRPFLGWSLIPGATVERNGCKARVYIGDARYGSFAERRSRLARETVIDLCVPKL
jgi:inner membrane protein